MQLWQDAVVAALAATGIASMVWVLLCETIFYTAPNRQRQALVLLPARGDGDGLEQQVRSLELLRRERGLIGPVLLVDCGLTEEGRRLCSLLERGDRRVILCQKDQITDFLD